MTLPVQFLDDLRARVTLSGLIGRSVKLTKAGRELKGCCPFHSEKTPSFTVNDDKGFYHCFGCGAHGDVLRWLTDHDGMAFMDAVRQLAEAAGIEVPARSPEAQARADKALRLSDVLDAAARWYAGALEGETKAEAALTTRGLTAATIAKFGIGFAPAKRSVAGCAVPPAALEEAGLLIEERDGYRDRFRNRLMIPIHDARGRIVGFAGRMLGDGEPKYLNSPESAAFAKGDILFNLHRAAPAARKSRRLIIVEGQFDTIALDQAGIEEAVAPQGSALTDRQLVRAWRVIECPTLLFDGDAAGRKAALRAAERAMPHLGPGQSLSIAMLPEGEDPDSLARSGGAEAIESVIGAARPLADWLFDTLLAGADIARPEGRAGLWTRLRGLASAISDAETRAQYLTEWRTRFDTRFPPLPPGLTDEDISPDGDVGDLLSGVGAGERANLENVAAAWLERETGRLLDRIAAMPAKAAAEAAGRLAWEIGRRAGGNLVRAETAADAIDEIADARGDLDLAQLRRSLWIGCRRAPSLVAAMRLDRRCAFFERTDKGNAERWHARYGQDYLYTTAKGWLGWDGRRYRVLNQEKDTLPAEVLASVIRTVEAIAAEARFVDATGWPEHELIEPKLLDELEDDPRREGGLDRLVPGKKAERLSGKLAGWALTSQASGRIGCITGIAKAWVTVELSEFDTDPMLLNCMNGTLRFIRADEHGPARVEMRPHDRADRLTKLTACDYDPDAPAPIFQKLVKWAQPDREVRRYLRQWLGYNLTGDMGAQIFQIWYGPLAANGKSTVGNVCREAIGDYGDTTNVQTFLDEGPSKRGDAATPDIVRLPGVRFLTAGEPPKGAKINEPLINSVTGGDPMLARDNFRSFFRFLPIFKFTLWCNDLPAIPQGTAGIWRRVKVMLWEQHLKEDERDGELPKKLQAEYAGVLAWMVRGLLDWMEHGFIEPESVQLASAEYKSDSDPLSTFLRVCTVVDATARVQGSDLYATFCAWAKAAGEVEWKPKGFAQAVKAKGIAHKHSNGTHWLGLKLIRFAGDFVDSEGKVRDRLPEEPPPSAGPPSALHDPDDDDLP